jgi:hypothetical protein
MGFLYKLRVVVWGEPAPTALERTVRTVVTLLTHSAHVLIVGCVARAQDRFLHLGKFRRRMHVDVTGKLIVCKDLQLSRLLFQLSG